MLCDVSVNFRGTVLREVNPRKIFDPSRADLFEVSVEGCEVQDDCGVPQDGICRYASLLEPADAKAEQTATSWTDSRSV